MSAPADAPRRSRSAQAASVAAPPGLPLVSIVVPVFNGERFLRASLDSILAQTYARIEVQVIDDGSTDATPALIAAYGDRVQSCRNAANRGQFAAVNAGIGRARGEFVIVCHADDVYHPRLVEREVDFLLDHPAVGAVFCRDVFIDPLGRAFGRLELPRELRGRRTLDYADVVNALLRHKNVFLRTPGAMVRAAAYREVGLFEPGYGIAADLEMWLRIARRRPLGLIHEHLFAYRTGHDHASGRHYRLRTEPERHFEILDRHLREGAAAIAAPDALLAHHAHRAEDHLMLAVNQYILGNTAGAAAHLRQSRPARIAASPRVQRARLLALHLLLRALVSLPRAPLIAHLFYARWHARGR